MVVAVATLSEVASGSRAEYLRVVAHLKESTMESAAETLEWARKEGLSQETLDKFICEGLLAAARIVRYQMRVLSENDDADTRIMHEMGIFAEQRRELVMTQPEMSASWVIYKTLPEGASSPGHAGQKSATPDRDFWLDVLSFKIPGRGEVPLRQLTWADIEILKVEDRQKSQRFGRKVGRWEKLQKPMDPENSPEQMVGDVWTPAALAEVWQSV